MVRRVTAQQQQSPQQQHQQIGRPPIAVSPQDPYAHTKKTRTKPTRNADGILIRKDGRPDMRSQSSAANLRKVHARKEAERAQEMGTHGPTSGLATAPVIRGNNGDGNSPDPNTDEGRHRVILKQVFPDGVKSDLFQGQFWGDGSPTDKKPSLSRDDLSRQASQSATPSDDEDGSENSDDHDDDSMDVDETTPAKNHHADAPKGSNELARTSSQAPINGAPERLHDSATSASRERS